jgi:hypothetical protein
MYGYHEFEDLAGNELKCEVDVSYKVVETIVEFAWSSTSPQGARIAKFTHRCEYWLPEKAPDTIAELSDPPYTM